MPTTSSAKKRHRQSLAQRTRNRAVKSVLKTQIKHTLGALEAGDLEKATGELRLSAKKFDQAAAKGVIHRNRAARIKSRLSAKMKAAQQAAKQPAG